MTPKKYFHQKCDKKKKYQDIQKKLFLAQKFSSVQKPKSNINSHENTNGVLSSDIQDRYR
jgi:hypothetical protein